MNLLLDGNYILSVPYFCFYFYRGNILGGPIWPHLWLPLHNDQRPRYTRKFPATNSLINCSTVRKHFCKDIFVELVVGIQSILMAQICDLLSDETRFAKIRPSLREITWLRNHLFSELDSIYSVFCNKYYVTLREVILTNVI